MRVPRALQIAAIVIGVSAVGVAGLAYWALRQSLPPMPVLAGQFERGTLTQGGRTRSWHTYVPATRAQSPALVIVLHSSMGSARQAREMFGYDFDVLAERDRFIVSYPNGVDGHWNEAKVRGPFAAKTLRIIQRRKRLTRSGEVRHAIDMVDIDRTQVVDRHAAPRFYPILQAASAAMFRMSFTVELVEQIWIGFFTPVKMGPITVAPAISCISLTEMLAECRAGKSC